MNFLSFPDFIYSCPSKSRAYVHSTYTPTLNVILVETSAPSSFGKQLQCSPVNITLMVIKKEIAQSAWGQSWFHPRPWANDYTYFRPSFLIYEIRLFRGLNEDFSCCGHGKELMLGNVIIVPCCASSMWEKNSKTAKILWNTGHLKEQVRWAKGRGHLEHKMAVGPLKWDIEQNSRRGKKPHLGWRGSNIWWWEETRLCVVSTMQYTDDELRNCTPETI